MPATPTPTKSPYRPLVPVNPKPTTVPEEKLTPTPTVTPSPKPTKAPTATPTPTATPVVAEDGKMTVSGTEEDWTQVVDALESKIAEYEKLLEDAESSKPEDGKAEEGGAEKEDESSVEIPIITINVSKDSKIPASVLDAIAEKEIIVNLDMGNGFVWSISGTSVKESDDSDKQEEELQSLDFGIKSGTDNIPKKKSDELAKDKKSTQFSITHDGAFGFDAKLVMDVETLVNGEADKADKTDKEESKKENKKELYANLYYYNVKKAAFEYICTGKIDADYKVAFVMNHASDYVVVVDDAPAAEAYDTYTVVSGDTLWKIAQEQLGDGRRYKEIMELNGLKSDTIRTGAKFLIPGTAKVVINELSIDVSKTGPEDEKPQEKPETPEKPNASEEIVAEPVTRKYIVKKGDCLWSIAQECLGAGNRYKEIMKLSGLKSDMLFVGQELTIPEK